MRGGAGLKPLPPTGLVLVTDAVPALGLGDGRHTLGQQEVEVDGLTAYVAGERRACPCRPPLREQALGLSWHVGVPCQPAAHPHCVPGGLWSHRACALCSQGTKTLSGSIAPMDVCVRHFLQATGQ